MINLCRSPDEFFFANLCSWYVLRIAETNIITETLTRQQAARFVLASTYLLTDQAYWLTSIFKDNL